MNSRGGNKIWILDFLVPWKYQSFDISDENNRNIFALYQKVWLRVPDEVWAYRKQDSTDA